ncbi:MAG: GDSL-type esterase/lipase family protein [Bacteroidota bacterium]
MNPISLNSKNGLKPLTILAICFLFSSVFFCCDEEEPPIVSFESLNKIMPLGASRVEGARPDFESFRYELWKLMTDNTWDFDYIGTLEDEATYPSFSGADFDPEHEGRGGWTSGQILEGIEGWLDQAGAPDIVLFSSPGGNDALTALPYDQTVSNINAIIDILQAANPNITILIEQMAPGRSDLMTAELLNYFGQLQQEVLIIADEKSTNTSEIIPIDMFTGFDDTFLADDVHYNEEGASFIANRYYDVLQNKLKR